MVLNTKRNSAIFSSLIPPNSFISMPKIIYLKLERRKLL